MPIRQHRDELVAMSYVTERLAISRQTVYRLEAEGVLHSVRLTDSSHRRFRRAEVDALVAG